MAGFCASVCQRYECRKKLPSHDRLTTDKGVEPLTANKNKDFEKTVTLLSPPFQSYQPRFGFYLIERTEVSSLFKNGWV